MGTVLKPFILYGHRARGKKKDLFFPLLPPGKVEE